MYIVHISPSTQDGTLAMTFQCHSRLAATPVYSPHMISYQCVIETYANSVSFWNKFVRYVSDLAFDLSRSLTVKCCGARGLHIYDFLLVSKVIYGLTQLLCET